MRAAVLAIGAPFLVAGLRQRQASPWTDIPPGLACAPGPPPNLTCVVPGPSSYDTRPGSAVSLRRSQDGHFYDPSPKCEAKYPESGIVHMARLFRAHSPTGRVFIALNLHQNRPIMDNLARVLEKFVARLGPESVVLSIFESRSDDGTTEAVLQLEEAMRRLGARTAVKTSASGGNELVEGGWVHHDPSSGYRIDFMAKMRNAALDPLYVMRRQGESFDKVLFINDILVCEGDLWRLLSLKADMACAYDFGFHIFYDSWVYDGQFPENCIPQHNWKYPHGCKVERPVQVKSCWGGMAAIDAGVFYAGVRFRPGVLASPDDCRASECTMITRDMWHLGFRTILADPTVQVAYEYEKGYHLMHSMSPEALFDDREQFIPDASLLGDLHYRSCCPLEGNGTRRIDLRKCWAQPFRASAALPYSPEWLGQFEVHWYAGATSGASQG